MDKELFWGEVKRRRNHFYFTWVGWLVAGPILWSIYDSILPIENQMVTGFLALITWGAFWGYIHKRLKKLKCFNCNKPAIGNAFFFMKHAKCQHCGVTPNGI